MTTTIPAILLALSAAAAPTTEVDQVLARMTTSQGGVYLAARDELLVIGADALPLVEQRLAAAKSPAERSTLLAARAWLLVPEACAHAYSLDGLDPARWTRARVREPQVARELGRLPPDARPVLIELWTKTRDVYPYAPAAAYPKGLDPRTARAMEEQALAAGVLHALGGSGLDLAPALLTQALVDERDPVLRRTAAQALGATKTAGAVSTLGQVAFDRRDDASVRAAALVGLGSHRSAAALDVLARMLASDEDTTLRTTAATALANLASAWAAHARGDLDGGAALQAGALQALRAVKTDDARLKAAVSASLARLGG